MAEAVGVRKKMQLTQVDDGFYMIRFLESPSDFLVVQIVEEFLFYVIYDFGLEAAYMLMSEIYCQAGN